MKGVIPWLVRWAGRAGTRDFYPAVASLISPVQNMFFLPVYYFMQFMCPRRPATWAGSRAGPPFSECVSPIAGNEFGLADFI
jgi:hypothetical protein